MPKTTPTNGNRGLLASWSLRKKLLLLLLTLFLPASGIMLASGLKNRRQEITKAQNDALLLAQSLAMQQERVTTSTKVMLSVLTQSHTVRSLDAAGCNRLFRGLQATFPFYSAILSAATPDGKMFAASLPFTPGSVDLSDRKHIEDALHTRRFSVGEYMTGRVSHIPSLNYVSPVLDAQGKPIALLAAGFKLEEYANILANVGLPAGYSVTLTDWKGVRLFRTPASSEAAPGTPIPQRSQELSRSADRGFFDATKNDDGEDRIYAFKQLHLDPQSPPYMYIYVGIPKAQILHKANLQLAANLSVIVVAALLAMALAWVFGDFLLVRPINRLVAATRQFGRGEMETRTGLPHGFDELGRLAESFDYMATLLEDQRSAIEATIAERTAELLAAQRAGQIGSWRQILSTGAITWSEELYRISGRDPAKGAPSLAELGQIFTAESWARLQDTIQRLILEPDSPPDLDLEIVRPDGTHRWALGRCEVDRDAQGCPVGLHSTMQDITERKRAEQVQRESEERFRRVIENAPLGMFIETDGYFQYVNPAALAMFGAKTADQFVGQSTWDGIHPSYHESVRERVRLLQEGAVVPFLEEQYVRLDGASFDVAVSATPFAFEGRRGAMVFFSDITERKQIEQALRKSEERFRQVVEGAPVGMYIQTGGIFRYVNPAALTILGAKSADEIIGQPFWDRVHPDSRAAVKSRVRNVDEGSSAPFLEERYVRLDGTVFDAEVSAVPFSYEESRGAIVFFRDVTKRKRAEEEVRKSEARVKENEAKYRAIVGAFDGLIYTCSQDYRIEFMNRRFIEQKGRDATGELCYKALHNQDSVCPWCVNDQVFRGETVTWEIQSPVDTRWYHIVDTPIYHADGSISKQGMIHDITGRKAIDEALRISEERLKLALEASGTAAWDWNPQTGKVVFSGQWSEMFGYAGKELTNAYSAWEGRVHPEDTARVVAARQACADGLTELYSAEYRFRCKDGSWKWVISRGMVVARDAEGQASRMLGVFTDISQIKQMEEALRLSEERLKIALEASESAAWDWNYSTGEAMVSDHWKMFGWRENESRKGIAEWESAIHPDDKARAVAARQTCLDGHAETFSSEYRLRRKDGGWKWVLSRGTVVARDSAGNPVRLVGTFTDISHLKQVETELIKAKEMAEAANRAKSEFLANTSHEIRTPMNGVIGMTGLLLGTELSPEQRHYAEVVDASAKSLLELINDILDLSKMEARKFEVDKTDFNLRLLMDDLATIMAGRIGDKSLEFVYLLSPDVPALVQGDPGRLRQVLVNLSGNAIKFTKHGEVVVRVALLSETDEQATLRFSVRDTGAGIPADKQHLLFRSFSQVDSSSTRHYGGSGLGLAISKQLVKLMGGEIGLESEPGKGSEFWFTVPLLKQPESRLLETTPSLVEGKRILVVSAHAAHRESLTSQLRSWRARVTAVEDGAMVPECLREAVEAGDPFEAAILDRKLATASGEALARIIVADEALKKTRLIMLTALGERGDARRFREIGLAAYLTKPVRQSDLFDCLATVLGATRSQDRPPLVTRHSLREARRSGLRILLVEDNPTNQEVADGILQRLGWQADLAGNGKQALQRLATQAYDLVLMDLQMPEMDGYEATRNIRDPQSAVLNHDIPIIAITADAMMGDDAKCLASGMNDYIAKPIDPAILAKVVEKWMVRKPRLERRESSAQPSAPGPPPEPAAAPRIFNREAFLQRMMGDEEFARAVAAGFLEDLPGLVSALKQRVAQEDLASVCKEAHKIKGSAANVGGEALKNAALEMEKGGKAGDLAGVVARMPELELQTARLQEALGMWIS